MSQMCPNCSHDNPDGARTCANCPSPLYGLLGENEVLESRYQVVSVLGFGAMGAVYLANDQRLVGRRCAIKENRPDTSTSPELLGRMREQFLAEARVLARLDHAALPKVSDYFVVGNNREYLVMDYVEGEDLLSLLERTRQPLDEDSVLSWAEQVLDALAYLHSQRPLPIIHRDIKPANIRVNLQQKAKLVDFGLVKLLDTKSPATKIELRGMGTPAYAPLEQFAGSHDHTDARSDIYALGATLYHLLTNLYPPAVHDRMLQSETLTPPRHLNPNLSENTEQVILKAMEIYPDDRYQTAEEMRRALSGRGRGAVALPPDARKSKTKKPPPLAISPWLFGLVGLVIVLLILGGVSFALFRNTNSSASGIESPTAVEESVSELPTPLFVEALGDAPTHTPLPTPVVQETQDEASSTPTDTPTPVEASPTATAASQNSSVGKISESSLVGVIAYPVFNGNDYDLYFGQADGSGTQIYRKSASQPAFSPDGSRIAFHSWRLDSWGLMTMDLSGDNIKLIANFIEDQLPTWTPDSREILFLSRREGDRKSRILKVGSSQVGSDGLVLGEGEYPTIGKTGDLVFKGWGSSGSGIRRGNTSLQNIQVVTTLDEDTAPALSPDGTQIAFMSRRDGNWEIYMVNADGSNLQRLTNNGVQDGLPTWSPDGSLLAFLSNRGGSWAVWVTTPDGSDQLQLFVTEGSPDGFVGTDRNASRGWTEERISWKR
jgi:serine/threonine protein kinase